MLKFSYLYSRVWEVGLLILVFTAGLEMLDLISGYTDRQLEKSNGDSLKKN